MGKQLRVGETLSCDLWSLALETARSIFEKQLAMKNHLHCSLYTYLQNISGCSEALCLLYCLRRGLLRQKDDLGIGSHRAASIPMLRENGSVALKQ
jgi:hypothetical protein